MKKAPLSSKRIITDSVSTFRLQFYIGKTGISRFCGGFLILALLLQVLTSGPIRAAKASGNIPAPVPFSAPPEPFLVQNPPVGIRKSSILAANLLSSLLSFFAEPELSTGVALTNHPTFREKFVASASSLFALIVPEPEQAINKNQNPAAPPMMTAVGSVTYDFNGDGKADIGRWHSSNTEFKVKLSESKNFSTFTVGSSSAKPAPGDFDGDGNTDAAVFDSGTWTYKTSPGGTSQTFALGQAGDTPMTGDFDADGTSDAAVFHPATNVWTIRYTQNGATTNYNFGLSGDIPTVGDYDGDGITDIAVFRPCASAPCNWHIQKSTG